MTPKTRRASRRTITSTCRLLAVALCTLVTAVGTPVAAHGQPAPTPATEAVAGPVGAAQAAVGCYGNGTRGKVTCNGKDPDAQNCGDDAYNLAKRSLDFVIELRYSPNCGAVWTRYTNTWGLPGTIEIEGKQRSYSKTALQYSGEKGWTPMIASADTVRACATWYIDFNTGIATRCTKWV